MPDLSFSAMATKLANTKKAGLSAGYEAYLYDLPCYPLAPLDTQTQQRLDLKTPHATRMTFFEGAPDIKNGHKLVIDDVEYPVKYVEEWPFLDDTRLMVVVEDLRK